MHTIVYSWVPYYCPNKLILILVNFGLSHHHGKFFTCLLSIPEISLLWKFAERIQTSFKQILTFYCVPFCKLNLQGNPPPLQAARHPKVFLSHLGNSNTIFIKNTTNYWCLEINQSSTRLYKFVTKRSHFS